MKNLPLSTVAPEHLVHLAAMECFASCVLTYVRMLGGGRLPPMPDYWNLQYSFRTLLSSKDARHYSLSFHYGIRMSFVRGDGERLREAVAGGRAVILLCSASRWAYFPRHMLGLETSGFRHSVLVCALDPSSGAYRIADPTVGHIGDATLGELAAAGMRNDRRELNYFTLEPPEPDFRPPSAAEVFRYCCERNLALFDPDGLYADGLGTGSLNSNGSSTGSPSSDRINSNALNSNALNSNRLSADGAASEEDRRRAWAERFGGRNGGSRAFGQCRAELAALPQREPAEVRRWCERNNLTVASVWRVRQHVWDGFCRLGAMNEAATREGGDRVRRIVRRWQSFNYRLSRLKASGAASAEEAASLSGMLAELCSEEHGLLGWMHELGQSVSTGEEMIES